MQFSMLFFLSGWLISGLLSTALAADRSSVLIVGDSLSAAYNIAIERSWPELFRAKLQQLDADLTLANASISGETSVGGRQRLPDLLQRHQPNFVIIELGGNDGLRGYKFAETRNNLAQMIDLAQQHGAQVMLIGVRLPPNLGPVYNRRFQQIFENLADTKSVTYLPRFLEGVAASDPELMQADGIHPTAKAQPILADKVFALFQQMLAAGR